MQECGNYGGQAQTLTLRFPLDALCKSRWLWRQLTQRRYCPSACASVECLRGQLRLRLLQAIKLK